MALVTAPKYRLLSENNKHGKYPGEPYTINTPGCQHQFLCFIDPMYTYEYPVYQNYQKEPRQPSKIKRWGTTLLVSLLKCGKDFCNDTSIHGFNHIAAPQRLWIERFLWICACGLAIWEALNVSLGQLQRYNESPTVVTLEKDFRSWEYSMPAITCCYLNRMDMDKLPAVIKKYWGIEVHDEKYAYYTRFINAVASSDLFHLQKFEEFQDIETQVNMYQIALDVMPDLKIKLVPSEPGDWKWWPVMTEGGVCHVTNSLALADVAIIKPKPNETASSPVMCKNSANNCYIVLDNYALVEYYIHSPYDVVDFGQDEPSVAFLSLTRETELTIMESRCGRGVKELRPNRRGCQYTDEPVDKGRRVYSTNSCRLSCRSKIAMKLCGCVPFYYFYEGGPLCSPAGMWCLSSYTHNIRNNDDEKCPCAPQCVDSVFKEFDVKDQIWNRPPFLYRGSIKFTVQGPRTRYTREIVFHFQDLVVSFGGAAGLFLGASFISFIEILYFLLSRLFRVFIKTEKKNLNDQKTIAVKPKSHTTAHETVRLKQLSAVLATQRKYQQNDINLMNPIYY